MKTIYDYDKNDNEIEIKLPTKREVCYACNGDGTHVNPAIDGNGLSPEDCQDPDFMETYMGGRYDVACYGCGGNKVIDVVDRDQCTTDQLKAWDEWQDAERESAALEAAERRACC